MPRYAACAMLLLLVAQWGCSKTVVVPVPPRMDLKSYGTIGVVTFDSNSDHAMSTYATQQFQEQIQGAVPGTPLLELGNRLAVLESVGASQLDAEALTKIGKKYHVNAVFIGYLVYSEPKTDIRVADITKLQGGVRTEVRGDISSKLMETKSGASVWSGSAWAKRQVGAVSVSTKRGVNASLNDGNPRKEMVPSLMHHLTEDFRGRMVRQKVQ